MHFLCSNLNWLNSSDQWTVWSPIKSCHKDLNKRFVCILKWFHKRTSFDFHWKFDCQKIYPYTNHFRNCHCRRIVLLLKYRIRWRDKKKSITKPSVQTRTLTQVKWLYRSKFCYGKAEKSVAFGLFFIEIWMLNEARRWKACNRLKPLYFISLNMKH